MQLSDKLVQELEEFRLKHSDVFEPEVTVAQIVESALTGFMEDFEYQKNALLSMDLTSFADEEEENSASTDDVDEPED